jgi:hypothetical protein
LGDSHTITPVGEDDIGGARDRTPHGVVAAVEVDTVYVSQAQGAQIVGAEEVALDFEALGGPMYVTRVAYTSSKRGTSSKLRNYRCGGDSLGPRWYEAP